MTIPIIGQPQVVDVCVTATVKCPCGHVVLLYGKPQERPTACACGRLYIMMAMPSVDPEGHVRLPIGMREKL